MARSPLSLALELPFDMPLREPSTLNPQPHPLQTSELLKTLLDPETMGTVIEKNEFVELFYDK